MRDVAALRRGEPQDRLPGGEPRGRASPDLLADGSRAAAESSTTSSTSAPATCGGPTAGPAPSGCCWRTSATPSPPPAPRRGGRGPRAAAWPFWPASLDEDPERERELVARLPSPPGRRPGPHARRRRPGLPRPELRAGTALVFVDRAPGRLDADVVLTDNREAPTAAGRAPARPWARADRLPRRPGPHRHRDRSGTRLPRGPARRPADPCPPTWSRGTRRPWRPRMRRQPTCSPARTRRPRYSPPRTW